MDVLARLKLRTGELNEAILEDCMESAKSAIMSRRFPFHEWPQEIEPRYLDLQFRCAMEIYAKIGGEGEISHSENGISRTWRSSWISEELLAEVVPVVGSVK